MLRRGARVECVRTVMSIMKWKFQFSGEARSVGRCVSGLWLFLSFIVTSTFVQREKIMMNTSSEMRGKEK